ncbi:MAG: DUF6350 family protein [Microbacterium sp.]|uniref:cell division protein PerM n=1 Tax=Microbacterium sp. TaxID=51671 RepID=UPI003A89FC41
MYRLIVALLAALDAAIAAAAVLAAVLAPLTVLWVFGLGRPDWGALWPASASVWQLGHVVPLPLTLPDEYIVRTGLPADAAGFTLSLAPLAFAGFTAVFAARSGSRAAGASAWISGVLSGTAVFAALAAVVAVTAGNPVAQPQLWQAVLCPALVYLIAALAGAFVTTWRRGDGGLVDALRARVEALPAHWVDVPGLVVRGTAVTLTGLLGLGALALAVAVLTRGSEVIALFEVARVDALGATLVTLGQLVYLPTLIVWALAWIAGPGFGLGVGSAVSPAGTQTGPVPGIPILGAVPESISPWLLLVLLLPIGVGALAGWIVRSRRVDADPLLPRLVITASIGVLTGAGAALLAALAAGSMGPGRLAAVGPEPGPVAVAVGLEVLVGAGILLLGPLARRPRGAGTLMSDTLPVLSGTSR